MPLYGAQIRMARAALGWSIADTCKNAKMGIVTLRKLEEADEIQLVDVAKGRSAKGAFERKRIEAFEKLLIANGIVFIPPRGDAGPGVRYNGE